MTSHALAAYPCDMQSALSAKALCGMLLVAMLAAAAPAASPPATRPATQPLTPRLIHVPGIGGYLPIDRHFLAAIRHAGIDTIEHFDWTNDRAGLAALLNDANKHAQAAALAELLTARFRAEPARPICITAHSGGAAIAVWALQQLPDDVFIDRLLLLAPALAPDYDLGHALRRVRGRAYVFSSPLDPVLGPGTRILGTMDGFRGDAMGRVGFTIPPTADRAQYDKLIAMPYDDDWMRYDNAGEHIGVMTPRFTQAILVPLIQATDPDRR